MTMHGTRWAYQLGCKCPSCRQAEAAYHARYAKGLIPGWIDAGPSRTRLQALRSAGCGLDRLEILTGISFASLAAISSGRRLQVHPSTAAKILAVMHPSLADGALVSVKAAYQTRERIRRMVEEDYPLLWLSERLGRHVVALHTPSVRHEGARVRVRTWKRVSALYRQLDLDVAGGPSDAVRA